MFFYYTNNNWIILQLLECTFNNELDLVVQILRWDIRSKILGEGEMNCYVVALTCTLSMASASCCSCLSLSQFQCLELTIRNIFMSSI